MKKTFQKIADVIDKISEYSGLVFGMLIFPMIFAIVYSVIMRYFFSNSPSWAYEMPIFFYGIEVMMGGAYVLLKDAHVAVDLLPRMTKGVVNKIINVIICLVIIVGCVYVVVVGSKFAYQSTLMRERSPFMTPWNPEIWWFRWVIPISAVMVVFQAISRMIHIFLGDDNAADTQEDGNNDIPPEIMSKEGKEQ